MILDELLEVKLPGVAVLLTAETMLLNSRASSNTVKELAVGMLGIIRAIFQ